MRFLLRSAVAVAALLAAACGDDPTATPKPASGTPLTLTFCTRTPVWVGYQMPQDAWRAATSGGNGTFTIRIGESGGAFAVTYGSATSGYETRVTHANAAELTAIAALQSSRCSGVTGLPTKTLSGLVAGVPSGQAADVVIGSAIRAVVSGGAPSNYTLPGVLPGPRDLVASRRNAGAVFTADAVIVRRNLDVPPGTTLPPLDFTSAEAATAAAGSLSVSGVAPDFAVTATSSFLTANGARALLTVADVTGTTAISGIPATSLATGDLHELRALARLGGTLGPLRSVTTYVLGVGTHALSFGPGLTTTTISPIGSSPLRLRFETPAVPEYEGHATATYEQDRPTSGPTGPGWRLMRVDVSAAMRGSSTTWRVDVPDFGTSSGFDPSWGLRDGTGYRHLVTTTSATLMQTLAPSAGLTIRTAGHDGIAGP